MEILIYIAGIIVLGAIESYRAKRENQKRIAEMNARLPGVDAVQFPIVTESQPVPILFGTHWLRGPNVLWYGFMRRRQVSGDRELGVIRFDGVVYLSFCRGPIDKVLRITGDDVLIDDTERDLTSGPVSYALDRGQIWGYPQKGGQGGINAKWTLYPGFQDQAIPELFDEALTDAYGNPYTDFVDENDDPIMPAFRGLFTVMLGGYLPAGDAPTIPRRDVIMDFSQDNVDRAYLGTSPILRPIDILAQRLTLRGLGEAQWYPAAVDISTTEMNPAHIIHELMTDETFGFAIPSAYMDDALDGESSFQVAANQLAGTDQIGLSFVWGQQSTRLETIMEVLRHINGAIVRNPKTGKYELRLFRDDYTVGDLPLWGPESIESVNRYSRPDVATLPTIIEAKYIDRETGTEKVVKQDDQGGLMTRGEIREEVYYQMAARGDMAAKIATQYMLERSAPLATVELSIPLALASDLLPGDVFRWAWPDYDIVQMVLRVVSLSRGSIEDGNVRVRCIEDQYAWRDTIYAPAPDSGWLDPVTPALDADATQFESPMLLWLAAVRERQPFANINDLAEDRRGVGALCVFRPNDAHLSYDLWSAVTSSLPRRADFGVGWSAQVLFDGTLHPTSFTDAGTVAATTTITLKSTSALPEVGSLLLIGSGATKNPQEIMLVTDQYEDGGDQKIDVQRALMDTVEAYTGIGDPVGPVDAVATVVGFAIDAGRAPFEIERLYALDVPRTTSFSSVRALTSTGRGDLAYDDATSRNVLLEGRPFLPIAPYIYDISEAASEITISWRHRNRLVDRLVFTTENVTAEPGVTYTLIINEASPNPGGLRTVTSLDGTDDDFVYTNAMENSDRGGGLASVLIFILQAHRDGEDSYFLRAKKFTRV